VRLDFTFNWQKPTEIASRIQSIMPPDTAAPSPPSAGTPSTWSCRAWSSLEERPNLIKLTKYIEGGIEPVLEGDAAPLLRAHSAPAGATCRR
jgi:conjugal transfer pilus assembly protein TraD